MSVPPSTSLSMSVQLNSTYESISVLSVTLNPIAQGTTPIYSYQCNTTIAGSNSVSISASITVRGMHIICIQAVFQGSYSICDLRK